MENRSNGMTLRERREQRGLSLASLAHQAGVAEKTVRNLEHGTHSPTMRTASSIARVLEISIDELMAGSPA